MGVKVTSVSLKQETYDKFKKIISIKQVGFNTVLKSLVEKYIKDNIDLLERFDKAFPELKK